MTAADVTLIRTNDSTSTMATCCGLEKSTIATAMFFIGCIALLEIGMYGYFQIGSLSQLGQVSAIVFMATGCSGGIIYLLVWIVPIVKNYPKAFVPWIPLDTPEGQLHLEQATVKQLAAALKTLMSHSYIIANFSRKSLG